MRHVAWVSCLVVMLVASPAAHASECPASFENFLARFEADREFQMRHVEFPLKLAYIDGAADPAPAPRERDITREEYVAKDSFYPTLEEQATRRLEKKIIRPPTSNMVVEFDKPDSDAYSVNFTFTRTSGCWYLTLVDDQSL